MPINLTRVAASSLGEQDKAQLRTLAGAVYSEPDGEATKRDWATPECRVRAIDGDTLVCHVGCLTRAGTADGKSVVIGGVGGVLTHPDRRREGLAAACIDNALEWFELCDADFALLVCREELVAHYEKRGWRLFKGVLRATQFGVNETFTFNRTMVRTVRNSVEFEEIDLRGPPW